MLIKFLQLNIWYGTYIDEVIDFIKKENIDIINLQEVAGGKLNPNEINSFEYIKSKLKYNGELAVSWRLKDQKDSYFGNAIIFKPKFSLINKEIVWLQPYTESFNMSSLGNIGPHRNILSVKLKTKKEKNIYLVNTHLPRGEDSKDSEEKLKIGKIFYEYLKKIGCPFIISGDFNVDPSSKIISWLKTIGRNLSVENNVVNTLNPRIHYGKNLFPPGLCVDYIVTDNALKVRNFKVLEDKDFSDHLALYLEFDL